MKPSTREWIKKAEGDFLAAQALARRRKIPLHDQVCFHCQQSAEKDLKARLEEAHIFSPKTHDLKKLLNLVLPVEPLWSALLPALVRTARMPPRLDDAPLPPHSRKCRRRYQTTRCSAPSGAGATARCGSRGRSPAHHAR